MTKAEKLNKIFNNRLMKYFIPFVNPIITFINNGSCVITQYDCSHKNWIHKENGVVICIDKNPFWNISYKTMEKVVRNICCKFYLPKKGDIIVDLGAGVGSESIIFQRLVGETGLVYAVEAHPKTAFLLELLRKINKFKNVIVSQIAIGGSIGTVYIEDKKHHVANSINECEKGGIPVPMITIDQFVQDNKISKINYMKINIEGAEEDAINGMTESIKIIDNIAISCHDFVKPNSNDRIRKKVIDYLLKNGFIIGDSEDKHYIRRSWVYGKKGT